ncbi:unnamed protein product [Scytosiphon promiscuus]
MALRHRKLRVKANPSCFDLSTVLEPLRTECPNLIYLGIWFMSVPCTCTRKARSACPTSCLPKRCRNTWSYPTSPTTPRGELQEEWRSKPVRANKAIVVKVDATAVFVHPLGKESLQHITSKFIADLLNTLLRTERQLPGTQRGQETQVVL